MRHLGVITMCLIERIRLSYTCIYSKRIPLITFFGLYGLPYTRTKSARKGFGHAVYQGGSDMRMMSSSVPFGNPGVLRNSGSASFSRTAR